MDGFRASGNGSAWTTVPTRMSMAKNSSGVAIAERYWWRKACAELLVRLLGDPAFDVVGQLLPSWLENVHVPVLVEHVDRCAVATGDSLANSIRNEPVVVGGDEEHGA